MRHNPISYQLRAAFRSSLITCSLFSTQDEDGQVMGTHSISAGLDYPGVGPEHANLKYTDRAEYYAVDDKEALEGCVLLSRTEGVIPALETSHAVYYAAQVRYTHSDACNTRSMVNLAHTLFTDSFVARQDSSEGSTHCSDH